MPNATLIVRKAALRPDQVVDTVALDHLMRKTRHAHLTSESGLRFNLDLARDTVLEDGDALRLDDGRLIAVRAAEERLLAVRAGNPARLMRLAWQLGGSHVPAEIGADLLYVPESAAELVRASGCEATPVTRAFRPEREAHDHSQCGHDHHHDGHHHHDHGDEPRTHAPHDLGPGHDHRHEH